MAATNGDSTQDRAKGYFASSLAYTQRQVDRVVSPPTRQKAIDATTAFANERPVLFGFVVSQVLFSFLPLVLFVAFAVSTIAFSLVAGTVFALFWIGAASLVLVPALFFAFTLGVLLWVWAVSVFFVCRWIYNALPVSIRGEARVPMPDGKEVIFQKRQPGAANNDYGIKTEVKE